MYRLILASASPRRKFLLENAGYVFTVHPSHISENPNKNMSIDEQILDIALRKARSSHELVHATKALSLPYVILAVDTEVVIDNQLIGKPKDREDARRILNTLSGRTHEVKSAVVLIDSVSQKVLSQIETSQIHFKKLTTEEIENYLLLNEYFDKAGAYAMQGEGQKLVASFEGNWDNIVGLPMGLLEKLLKQSNIEVESKLSTVLSDLKESLNGRPLPRIIAVSKLQSLEKIKQMIHWGQTEFGENYLQEALLKIKSIPSSKLIWHFIGKIQKNKIKKIIENFNFIHTLSDLETAQSINTELSKTGRKISALLQVNLSLENTKSGYTKEALLKEWSALIDLAHIEIRGLMTMPPLTDDPEKNRPYFAELKSLLQSLKSQSPADVAEKLTELSMGTSHDYKVAADEGATMIRLGTILFGERISQ